MPAFIQTDATDIRRHLSFTTGGEMQGDEEYGNLAVALQRGGVLANFKALQDKYKGLAIPLDKANDGSSTYSATDAANFRDFVLSKKKELEAKAADMRAKFEAQREKFKHRNEGGDPHGLQKTCLALSRRCADDSDAAVAACDKVKRITENSEFDAVDIEVLQEALKPIFLALRTPATHYLSVLIQTYDKHVSVPILRLYYSGHVDVTVLLNAVISRVTIVTQYRVQVINRSYDGEHCSDCESRNSS